MTADKLITKWLRRTAHHVRLLSIVEGALLAALCVGIGLFAGILLDHAFSLSVPQRAVILCAVLAVVLLAVVQTIVLPLARSISRLYVARRIEGTFPHFKDSLTTWVQLGAKRRRRGAGPLVARQAAAGLQGVDIDAGLDSRSFVARGYGFVALVLAVFVYSVLAPKSMLTSLLRIVKPWDNIPAPTRTHIVEVLPGDARAALGTNVEISADIRGAAPSQASIRWSRDGELWQNNALYSEGERWVGAIDHLETDILYYVRAGDAASRTYRIAVVVPPVVESVTARLVPPRYTGLAPREIAGGNIEAPAGTRVELRIASNKTLKQAALSFQPGGESAMVVEGAEAEGRFVLEKSGGYFILITDTDGLMPQAPVKYELSVVGDEPPEVAAEGPPDGAEVGLQDDLPFAFSAHDDYGLSRVVLHVRMGRGNAEAKQYVLPPGRREFTAAPRLVPELLGAQPGDTVSYYLEAFDNREGRSNSARTPSGSFTVAAVSPPLPVESRDASGDVRPGEDFPGSPQPAVGAPENTAQAPSPSWGPTEDDKVQQYADARSRLLEMMKRDREALDTIARHIDGTSGSPAAGARTDQAAPTETASEAAASQPQERQAAAEGQQQAAQGGPSEAPASGEASSQDSAAGEETAAGSDSLSSSAPSGAPSDSAALQGGAAQEESEGDGGATSPAGGESSGQDSPSSSAPSQGEASTGRPDEAGESQGASEAGEGQSAGQSGASEASATPSQSGGEGQPGSQAGPAGAPSQQSPSESGAGSPQAQETDKGAPGSEQQTGQPSSSGTSNGSSSPQDTRSQGAGESSASSGQSGSTAGNENQASSGESADSSDGTSSGSTSSGSRTASGMRPAAGGGTVRTGTVEGLTQPPDLSDGLDAREPSDQGAGQRIDATRKVIRALSSRMRSRGVDDGLLTDLGWLPARLRTFVREYEDVLAELDVLPYEDQIALESTYATTEVLPGERAPASVGSVDTADSARSSELTEAAKDFVREDISPRYRQMVEEYYRSLAGETERKDR